MTSPGSTGPALLFVAHLTACTTLERWAADVFAVPSATPEEIHANQGADFDHGTFTRVLSEVVTEDGLVDYPKLAQDPAPLDAYLEELKAVDFSNLSRNEKLATLLNAYNAFTLRLILDHRPLRSIQDIPKEERWDAARWNLGGEILSLNAIEHDRLRAHFVEPRIHFAINCASISCPPLPQEAFEGESIDAQLDAAASRIHTPGTRWFEVDVKDDHALEVRLFRVYLWFHRDFERVSDTVVGFASRHYEPLARAVKEDRDVRVSYLEYDWGLNAATTD
ncbi:MAG: DUF547 domain-containing protein [Myxococcota bacterium]